MNFLLPSPVSQPLPHLASSQLLSLLGKVPCQDLGTELFLFPGHPSPQCLPALPSLVMCLFKCQFLRPLLLPSINSNPLLIFISLTCFIFPITLIIWIFVLVCFPPLKDLFSCSGHCYMLTAYQSTWCTVRFQLLVFECLYHQFLDFFFFTVNFIKEIKMFENFRVHALINVKCDIIEKRWLRLSVVLIFIPPFLLRSQISKQLEVILNWCGFNNISDPLSVWFSGVLISHGILCQVHFFFFFNLSSLFISYSYPRKEFGPWGPHVIKLFLGEALLLSCELCKCRLSVRRPVLSFCPSHLGSLYLPFPFWDHSTLFRLNSFCTLWVWGTCWKVLRIRWFPSS